MRVARDVAASEPLARYIVNEESPGADLQSDADLLEYAKNTGATVYHPVGTCKMGSDPMAVVDEQLRVHGLDGLYVADASIMPEVVSGNTNAACAMIGQRASDIILSGNP